MITKNSNVSLEKIITVIPINDDIHNFSSFNVNLTAYGDKDFEFAIASEKDLLDNQAKFETVRQSRVFNLKISPNERKLLLLRAVNELVDVNVYISTEDSKLSMISTSETVDTGSFQNLKPLESAAGDFTPSGIIEWLKSLDIKTWIAIIVIIFIVYKLWSKSSSSASSGGSRFYSF